MNECVPFLRTIQSSVVVTLCFYQPEVGTPLIQRLKTEGKDALRFLRLVCTEGEGLVLPVCVFLNGGGASSSAVFLVVNFRGFSLYSGKGAIDLCTIPCLGGADGKKGLSWMPNSTWFFFFGGGGLALI